MKKGTIRIENLIFLGTYTNGYRILQKLMRYIMTKLTKTNVVCVMTIKRNKKK